MSIAEYLAELRRLLPSTRRERFLREAEAHLLEAAEAHVRGGLGRGEAEARAVESFGPATVVAERVRRETAPVVVRRASGVALVALSSLFLPLYAVPENLLPPAPWAERPPYLGALLGIALGCWLGALALAAVASIAPAGIGARALTASAVLGVGCGISALSSAIAWHIEAPATPWSIVAIAAPITAVALVGVVGAASCARERARIVS
jgi:hypothetical protein